MLNVIYILLPLAVSGLGFLTYRHPKIGRKILIKLMLAAGAVFVGDVLYFIGQSRAVFDIRTQSTVGSLKTLDALVKRYQSDYNTVILWIIATYAGVFGLYCLSFLFDDIHNPKRIDAQE